MAKPTAAPDSPRAPYVGWAAFTNGEWWELTRGVDFQQSAGQATRAARQWASVNRYRCQAHIIDEGKAIKVRFEKVVL